MIRIHGTAIALEGKGVLLRGPSGSGKSDLALRLIDQGARLVADDQTELRLAGGAVTMTAPAAIAGRLEVRGIGILDLPWQAAAPLRLVADLQPAASIERLPEPAVCRFFDIAVPLVRVAPFEASAPAKLRAALHALAVAPAPCHAASIHSGAGERSGPARLVLVTGLSGAGRSTALKALEDLGYDIADNLPPSLVPALVGSHPAEVPLALGIPIRDRDFAAASVPAAIDRLDAGTKKAVTLVFLECDDERLIQRYTETRHRHPMSGDRPVSDGIALERRLVSPLRARADLVIDTSALSPGDLKRLLHGHFAIDAAPGIAIFVTSFSYRHGLPRDADLVLDVRFLRNPHYVAALEPLTGLDPAIAAHIEADPDFPDFFEGLYGWLVRLLPRYEGEGKSYLTIAIGCTGGRHRSVHVAARLAARLKGEGFRVGIDHRDLERGRDSSGRGK